MDPLTTWVWWFFSVGPLLVEGNQREATNVGVLYKRHTQLEFWLPVRAASGLYRNLQSETSCTEEKEQQEGNTSLTQRSLEQITMS